MAGPDPSSSEKDSLSGNEPPRPTGRQLLMGGLGIVLLTVSAAWLYARSGYSGALVWVILGLVMMYGLVVCIVLHELAHAVAALLLGARVTRIEVGGGRILFGFRVCGVTVLVRSFVIKAGAVLPWIDSPRLFRTRKWLIVAAGPISNLAIAVALVWLLLQGDRHDPGVGKVALVALALVSGWMGVVNLVPRIPRSGLRSDGALLLSIPRLTTGEVGREISTARAWRHFQDRRYREALGLFAKLLQEGPGDVGAQAGLLHCLWQTDGADVALARAIEMRRELPPGQAPAPELLLGIAWYAVQTRDSGNLSLARQALDEITEMPDYGNLVRGAYHLAAGEPERAARDLESALRCGWLEVAATALALCYLALACGRLGDVVSARQTLRQARRVDPQCGLLEAVQSELDGRPSVPA